MSVRQLLEQEVSLPAEQVDVLRSLELLEQLLVDVSDKEALGLGEEFLPRIVSAHAGKANDWLGRLLAPTLQSDASPFQVEWLYPFMRRFQHLDISHLLGRRPNDYPEERQSVEFVELTVEEAEPYIREPVVVAHSEDVAAWSEQIRRVLQEPATFPELLDRTQLESAELILGALLGNFQLQQRGKFYETNSIIISPENRYNSSFPSHHIRKHVLGTYQD